MEFEGYCVKCRMKRTVKDGVVKNNPQRPPNGPGNLSSVQNQGNALPGNQKSGISLML